MKDHFKTVTDLGYIYNAMQYRKEAHYREVQEIISLVPYIITDI